LLGGGIEAPGTNAFKAAIISSFTTPRPPPCNQENYNTLRRLKRRLKKQPTK